MHSDAVQLCGATFFLFLARHSIYVKYVGVTRLALYFFMYCTLLYSMVLTMATKRKKEKFLLCLFRLSFHLDSFLWKYLEIDFIPKTTHFLLRWHCKVVTHIFFLPFSAHLIAMRVYVSEFIPKWRCRVNKQSAFTLLSIKLISSFSFK